MAADIEVGGGVATTGLAVGRTVTADVAGVGLPAVTGAGSVAVAMEVTVATGATVTGRAVGAEVRTAVGDAVGR
jgi:hypothetical protein